ncbi:sigma-54 interaction domain-containing protein [Papillibacter cinnamivorans]|uniref:PAS domain S-box-containing protein n=1 Tax=Papillibacter cinnamivorans DSM 12816 TaxID=1122930 RepID=A0A1W2BG76_9FIRM|nr:sigma 54-interacting transcriptional regulator [Papillibacter cinnamivorans]SMC71428.1 PAS domain S-box-containing protein [Papillibacter cinnamivorans DSM 12816]
MICNECGHKNTGYDCLECSWLSAWEDGPEESPEWLSRQELEEELACSRSIARRLNRIVEYSSNPLFATDGEGSIIKVNAAYEKISGFDRGELLGRNVKDLVGVLMSQSSTLAAIQTKEKAVLEQKLLRKGRIGVPTSVPVFAGNDLKMVVSSNWDIDEIESLKSSLEREKRKSKKYLSELERLREELLSPTDIIAKDKSTMDVLHRARKVGGVDSSVLITGETGTGKEEFAKYIHSVSGRRQKPFVRVNCGAIAQSIIESEFFGYEKGAFTGANPGGKKGFFETADNGTIFLDEIGELPYDMQAKLLRVLQEQEILRVGGSRPVKVNVRVISATNRDLRQMIQEKRFREDLFYRLSVVTLEIPPLRDRPNDILPLAMYFMDQLNRRYKMKKTLSRDAYKLLKEYLWPGNVRELKNVLEEAVIMSESDRIAGRDLEIPGRPDLERSSLDEGVTLEQVMDETEYRYMRQALDECKSMRKAALRLGVPPTTYARRLKTLERKMGIRQ